MPINLKNVLGRNWRTKIAWCGGYFLLVLESYGSRDVRILTGGGLGNNTYL